MKIRVRQISQGVEEINWRNIQQVNEDGDEDMPVDTSALGSTHGALEPALDIEVHREDKAGSAVATANANANAAPDHQHHDSIMDSQIEDDEGTPPKTPDASQATQPPPSIVQTQVTEIATQDEGNPRALADTSESGLRSDSESSGLKRKFVERGTSQGPSDTPENANGEKSGDGNRGDASTGSKSSPPPGQPSNERTSPPSPKVPKLVCVLYVPRPMMPYEMCS